MNMLAFGFLVSFAEGIPRSTYSYRSRDVAVFVLTNALTSNQGKRRSCQAGRRRRPRLRRHRPHKGGGGRPRRLLRLITGRGLLHPRHQLPVPRSGRVRPVLLRLRGSSQLQGREQDGRRGDEGWLLLHRRQRGAADGALRLRSGERFSGGRYQPSGRTERGGFRGGPAPGCCG